MLNETQRRAVRRAYRNLRDDRALTALETAALAGVDPTLYSKIENGWRVPTPEQRKAIARVLRVRVADLPSVAIQEAA